MATFNIFDRVLKLLARDYAASFLKLAFPNLNFELLETLENVELTLPERRADFVHRAKLGEKEYIVHLEFQLRHRRDFPRRMFEYSAMLSLQFDKPVISLALYLEPRRAPIPEEYTVKVGEVAVNSFRYPVIKLWEYREEIWEGKYREFAPLLVSLFKERSVKVLTREKELILAEKDPRKRADLLAAAVTIASRYFQKTFLWEFFREEVEEMRNASFIQEWLKEERKKALEEGFQEGKEQGLKLGFQQGLQQGLQQGFPLGRKEEALRVLQKVILKRFGSLPEWLLRAIDGWEVEQLELLVDLALEVSSLEEFEAEAKKILGSLGG